MTKKRFITIGTFDGVHIGHRYLFGRLESLAGDERTDAGYSSALLAYPGLDQADDFSFGSGFGDCCFGLRHLS